MDKASERSKDHKECGDIDIGVQDYKAGGKREQLAGLWNYASEEVVGLDKTRLITNCYCKEEPGEKKDDPSLLDIVAEHGPPLTNTSKPHRIF
jgi:hypothetical protein